MRIVDSYSNSQVSVKNKTQEIPIMSSLASGSQDCLK